jgi:hypothetical protein
VKKPYKSKTINTALVITVLGIVELNMHMLRDNLGDWYGFSYIAIGCIMAWLRFKTTEGISDDE